MRFSHLSISMPSITHRCRAILGVGVLAAGLSGCVMAAPSAFQVASYAADGASYAATGKTVTDHLISTATAKDCVMSRLLDGQDICQEKPEGPYARLPDGTLAPNAKDAAMDIGTPESDKDFQTFAATTADQGPFDNADVWQPAPTPDRAVRWAKPPAPLPTLQPSAPVAAPTVPVETAALQPLGTPPTPNEPAPITPAAPAPSQVVQADPPVPGELPINVDPSAAATSDEGLAPVVNPSAGDDVLMIGDDEDELLSPADLQAIMDEQAPR